MIGSIRLIALLMVIGILVANIMAAPVAVTIFIVAAGWLAASLVVRQQK